MKSSIVVSVAAAMLSASAHSGISVCHPFGGSQSLVIIQTAEQSFCDKVADGLDSLTQQLFTASTDEAQKRSSDYWKEWAIQNSEEPFVTSHYKHNYFGLGVWRPSQYDDQLEDMDYDEYIKAHGLQFSIGMGEPDGDEPRMRIDYQWHKLVDPNVSIQVEVPF